jgi:hypothetical protein
MLDYVTGDLYGYVGGGVFLGASATVSASTSRPSTGINAALQGSAGGGIVASGQWGYSWGQGPNDPGRGFFLEGGGGFGTPSLGGTVFYSWKVGNLCQTGH